MLIDAGADTCCAGKYAYIIDFVAGISVSYRGFSDNLPIADGLSPANVIYAYDCRERGEIVLLQLNHCIYLGNKKYDAIVCPNQRSSFKVMVDKRPSSLFSNETNVQSIKTDGLTMPLKTKGPLTYLLIYRPTKVEVKNKELHLILLTSSHEWDPYGIDSLRSISSSI